MSSNNIGSPKAARAVASGLGRCVAAAVLASAPALALTEGPVDAFAVPEDAAPAVSGQPALPLDSFASGTEYAPFPPAEVTLDAWAAPGDKPLLLSLEPDGEAGTYDALSLLGDELERYRPASWFEGGYGPGDKRCVILMYHRFRAVPANKFEVSYADFRAQLDYIAGNGYEVIPVDQLVEALQTQDADLLPPRSVVITVDDGFRCVYDFAWPLLAEYEFPFAVYVYTNYVGGGGNSMTWSELRDLASDDLVTLGAHSQSHRDLADPRKAFGPYELWIQRELTYPKYRLEAETGKPIRTFAWPYGSFNSYAMSAAIRAGYEGLLTIYTGGNSMETSPYHLRRYGVYWHTPLPVFARMLEGRPISEEMWEYGFASAADDEFLIP